MKAPAFAYARPRSRDEVFELLARYGDDARLLAGGQSLLASLGMRLSAPAVLIDINGVADLAGIRVAGDAVRIGALARHREVERSPVVARHLPLVARAMPHVAHAAIRNRGTFGGSLCNADPAAEWPACAVALDATLVLAGRAGERRVKAREFFRGLYETALEPGEILVAGEFRRIAAGERAAFGELARRHGDYAIVGLAAQARVTEGTIAAASLAFFGVGATPVLAAGAAAALTERPCTPDAIAAAQDALASDLEPFDDVHHSAATKLHLARVLLGRLVGELIGK